ncbi:hypothetical protein BGZ67_001744, partial [Mortierella alpina]
VSDVVSKVVATDHANGSPCVGIQLQSIENVLKDVRGVFGVTFRILAENNPGASEKMITIRRHNDRSIQNRDTLVALSWAHMHDPS